MIDENILLDAIGMINDDAVKAAGEYRRQRFGAWKRWACAACLCLMLGALLTLPRNADMPAESMAPTAPGPEEPGEATAGEEPVERWPGGLRPSLRVKGKTYYWYGLSEELRGVEFGYVYSENGTSVLPEGFAEYAALGEVSPESPDGDCAMTAGFEASGTVYTNEAAPEAVYVLMSTEWFEEYYIRFVSAELDEGYRIMWQGRHYELAPWIAEGANEKLLQLPEGCVSAGELEYIGRDKVPQNELETNCPADGYGQAFFGRQIWYDPADETHIYVYQRHYWSGGEYDEYLKCPLWEK